MRTTGAAARLHRPPRAWRGLAAAGCVLAATLAGLSSAPAAAATQINVPAQFPTIQGAIDAASAGDAVVVAPGTYHERIDFKGKAIEVRSSAGPATTTIDGDGVSHVVRFRTGEGRTSILRGFTITHGLVAATIVGGGIAVENTSPTIVGNEITGNNAGSHTGAGIGVVAGSPLIQGNHIFDNHTDASGAGGGLILFGAAEVIGNVIEGNSAGGGGGVLIGGDARLVGNVIRNNHAGVWDGGGVTVADGHPLVSQNLITGNSAELRGGGMYLVGTPGSSQRQVVDNTIADNLAPNGSAILGDLVGVAVVNNVIVGGGASTIMCDGGGVGPGAFRHNLVFGGTVRFAVCADQTGTAGNISAAPLFVAPADYRLQAGSPAIDAGDATLAVPLTDFAGQPRITDGNGDGTAVVDMGAYEAPTVFRQQLPYTVWTQPSGTPLDGIGSWVDVLTDPVATAGQAPASYLYGRYFGFVNGGGALGVVGLATGPTGKQAVFGVVEANGKDHTLSIPYNWAAGALYFPLVYQVGPGTWAAWVSDFSSSTWTLVGILTLSPTWGKLVPATITAASWTGPPAGACSAYPDSDVLFYPTVGYVGTALTLATATTAVGAGQCPAVTSAFGEWTRYQQGA